MAAFQMALALVLASPSGGAAAKTLRVVAFGDSLTAGLGLPGPAAFPSVLERRLKAAGYAVEVVNAGVSGDTASGGLERLDWSIPEGVDIAIVELGANDMLRAVSPDITRTALDTIIERLRARKIGIAIAGMRSLANWGEAYRIAFEKIYPDLAAKFGAPLYPFFLEGAAGHPDLLLPDGMHPNAAGVERMVDNFMPFIEPVLKQRASAPQD